MFCVEHMFNIDKMNSSRHDRVVDVVKFEDSHNAKSWIVKALLGGAVLTEEIGLFLSSWGRAPLPCRSHLVDHSLSRYVAC
jgi:hypothetical protein